MQTKPYGPNNPFVLGVKASFGGPLWCSQGRFHQQQGILKSDISIPVEQQAVLYPPQGQLENWSFTSGKAPTCLNGDKGLILATWSGYSQS